MLTAGIAQGVGDIFDDLAKGVFTELARAMAHGVTQGALSAAQGGDFAAGFFSGAFASVAGSVMGETDWGKATFQFRHNRVIAAAIVGGTVSELAGGKFANGAVTAAMVHLFNALGDKWRFQRRWNLQDAYVELESRGPLGKQLAAELRTKDIYSYKRAKFDYTDRNTGDVVYSKWTTALGFERGGKLYIRKRLNLRRGIETLIHEYSHTLGYTELRARVYATQTMHDLGMRPIRKHWIDANGIANPVTIKKSIPSSYNYKKTLNKIRRKVLLQTGVP